MNLNKYKIIALIFSFHFATAQQEKQNDSLVKIKLII